MGSFLDQVKALMVAEKEAVKQYKRAVSEGKLVPRHLSAESDLREALVAATGGEADMGLFSVKPELGALDPGG